MASFNRTVLMGNLSRDPELRVTPTGKAICQFGLAVNSKMGDREEVMFIDCEAWEKRGEAISKYFVKGRPILVEGRLKQDNWEDKTTGQKRSKIKLVVDNFSFVGGKDSGEGVQRDAPPSVERDGGGDDEDPAPAKRFAPPSRRMPPSNPTGQAFPPGDEEDQEIPF